ncbi:hypothetical protein TNCV_4604871 [Trichonephila clavipes]|nr:hypothetical protein TNCV_4604871 [Trichonephila clavipes]
MPCSLSLVHVWRVWKVEEWGVNSAVSTCLDLGFKLRDLPPINQSIEVHPLLGCEKGEHPEGGQGLPPIFPFQQPHERTCGSRLIKVPPCREGTIHLQTSMSSPGFEPSPNGTAVSVANHYTGWETTSRRFHYMY